MNRKNKPPEHYFSSTPTSEAHFGIIRASLCGRTFEFLTSSSVFSKKKVDLGTHVLIDAMVLPQKGTVLDIGCGYGAIGIVAAAFSSQLHVVMTDVNMRAVQLAKQNVNANHIGNAEVRYGYLYEPVLGLYFDCVLSNPPVSAGMDTVKAIIEGAPKLMTAGGSFQMVIRSKIGAKSLPDAFLEAFGNCEILTRESGYRVLMGKLC
ncbi:MAG: methyltransferase [Nitrososphaerota archaeon]|uniref:class I SAM-dependent methyltransferase n=1 Tax=Candidatus Bathycorpusculum sp. TaxID=2994959 RepID=UPI00282B128B|nr:methyltransferase [Candidatus Termitimicrobium sp.]MCL2432812.1 methyltransferase [Candidatus Termitimicrobium sp.]MDR0492648.1 methyltransferase [Nitrososphaerota archaeon]